jgi:hypothetical protein
MLVARHRLAVERLNDIALPEVAFADLGMIDLAAEFRGARHQAKRRKRVQQQKRQVPDQQPGRRRHAAPLPWESRESPVTSIKQTRQRRVLVRADRGGRPPGGKSGGRCRQDGFGGIAATCVAIATTATEKHHELVRWKSLFATGPSGTARADAEPIVGVVQQQMRARFSRTSARLLRFE